MDQRKRNALVAVIVLIVIPIALILAWRAWSGPGTLVAYTRAGGIAGITERTVVYRDGNVVVGGEREIEFRLSERQFDQLEETLAAGQWPRQPVVYGEPVPDGFRTDISYEGRMVTVYEPAMSGLPGWVQDVMDELEIVVPVEPLT
jgi:Zn-dependent protease with chaperone function